MLEGIIRESIGKRETKALRRDGYLIANIYGKGLENINAAFKQNEYIRTVRSKETLAFDVKVADKTLSVVIQSYESHPLTGELLHVDLMVAQKDIQTHYHVPVKLVGESIGLKNKGLVNLSKKRLRVKGLIGDLPKDIVIDISKMDIGDSKMIRDLDPIGNVTFTDSSRVGVVSIIKAK